MALTAADIPGWRDVQSIDSTIAKTTHSFKIPFVTTYSESPVPPISPPAINALSPNMTLLIPSLQCDSLNGYNPYYSDPIPMDLVPF